MARSARSEMTWKSRSAPRFAIGDVADFVNGDQFVSEPTGQNPAELVVVPGFDEFVDHSGSSREANTFVQRQSKFLLALDKQDVSRDCLEALEAQRKPIPIWPVLGAARQMNGFASESLQGLKHRTVVLIEQSSRDM